MPTEQNDKSASIPLNHTDDSQLEAPSHNSDMYNSTAGLKENKSNFFEKYNIPSSSQELVESDIEVD